MKSGLKSGRADQELDEIAKSLLNDESFLADDFDQMAHITAPTDAPMIPFAEFAENRGDQESEAVFLYPTCWPRSLRYEKSLSVRYKGVLPLPLDLDFLPAVFTFVDQFGKKKNPLNCSCYVDSQSVSTGEGDPSGRGRVDRRFENTSVRGRDGGL